MGYILIAVLILIIFYFVKERNEKVKLIKDANRFVESYSSSNHKLENTTIYALEADNVTLSDISTGNPTFNISDLKYSSLANFQKLLRKYKNNELSEILILNNVGKRHLIYPFKNKKGDLKLLIFERNMLNIEDVFSLRK